MLSQIYSEIKTIYIYKLLILKYLFLTLVQNISIKNIYNQINVLGQINIETLYLQKHKYKN